MAERGYGGFTAWVEKLIPHGGDCCHFVVERYREGGSANPWREYSDKLAKRALEKQGKDS